MRRKSERVREKDKPSEKKVDKSPKKSRRSSRRRKKSSSSSEESETDEYDTSFKSCKDELEEEIVTGKNVPEKNKSTHSEVDTKEPALTTDVDGKDRRHNKKQTADEREETPAATEHAKEKKEGSVEETDAAVENLDKHKESENKSSVWQVKSAACSGGEINKLKLCIVRPPEPVEPEPRKRKKLSRMPHRESDMCTGESDQHTTHDSQDEKCRSRKLLPSVSDESKSEYSRREGSTERKPKPESSSDEEQKVDSSEGAPVSLESSKNKGTVQEDSQDVKMRRKQGSEDHVKENKETSIDTAKKPSYGKDTIVESSAPVSLDPIDKCEPETSDSLKVVHGSVDENTKPSSSSEISPQHCPISPKETNVCNLEEKKPGVGSLSEGQKSSVSSDRSQISCNAVEEKSTVSDLSNASSKAQDTAKSVSKNQKSYSEIDVDDSKSKGDDFTEEKTKSLNLTEVKATVNKSEQLPAPLAKSTSRDSSDSEEERLSYRKLQESKKKSQRLTRHTTDPPEKSSGATVPLKTSTSKVETPHTSNDVQNSSKSTNKHVDTSKDCKYKDGSKDSPRLERKRYKNNDNRASVESTNMPQVKEKVFLKRSFSRVSDASASSHVPAKDEDVSVQDRENLEGHTPTLENPPTVSEAQPNMIRKRRWGASKSTATVKKPTLSISSDSLKHLIPEVKPLAISEVQLTEDEDEEEEGEVLDRVEDSFEIEAEVKMEKHREEGVTTNNRSDEKEHLYPLPMVPTPAEVKSGTVRKISIVSADIPHLQRSPSPARHRESSILFITNLVRPFTVNQLRELLARTGSIVDSGFWIDKIKSKCYVQYESETEARETRHALHGVRWPVSNPKQLSVDYAKKEDMDLARDLAEGNHIPRKTEPLKMERIDGWLAEQGRDKDREQVSREDRDRDRDRERDRADRVRAKDRHPVGTMETLEKSREAKVPVSVREWDLGKMDMESFDDRGFHREEKGGGERERRMRKDRGHRSPSRDAPGTGRKVRKKEEEAPAKLLDDLFKKTKVTPCVYWLPLTADQIVVKEEMRRKHMAEHERRMAEMRKAEKAERERHRARMQGRTSQRRFDERDKRRHRSPSTSPKK